MLSAGPRSYVRPLSSLASSVLGKLLINSPCENGTMPWFHALRLEFAYLVGLRKVSLVKPRPKEADLVWSSIAAKCGLQVVNITRSSPLRLRVPRKSKETSSKGDFQKSVDTATDHPRFYPQKRTPVHPDNLIFTNSKIDSIAPSRPTSHRDLSFSTKHHFPLQTIDPHSRLAGLSRRWRSIMDHYR